MKVLVMNCSPVRNGATAEIVNIVSDCLKEKYDVRSICIDDFDISFCKGCRNCHNTAKCIQDDDVVKIIQQYEWQILLYQCLLHIGLTFRDNLRLLLIGAHLGVTLMTLMLP